MTGRRHTHAHTHSVPDFRGPGEALGEVDPLRWRSKERRRGRRLDEDVTVQRVHLALDAAVRVLGVFLVVAGVVVLEGVPFVVGVQAVLLDQGLGDRHSTRTHKYQRQKRV